MPKSAKINEPTKAVTTVPNQSDQIDSTVSIVEDQNPPNPLLTPVPQLPPAITMSAVTVPSATLTQPGPLRIEIDGSGNEQAWKQWLKKFQNFIVAAGVTDKSIKKATLFNQAGDTFDYLASAITNEDDEYDDIIKKNLSPLCRNK